MELERIEELLKAKGFVTAIYDDYSAGKALGTFILSEDKEGNARALPLCIHWSEAHSCWKLISTPYCMAKAGDWLLPLLEAYDHLGLIPIVSYGKRETGIWLGAYRLVELSEETLLDKVWAFMECVALWTEAIDEHYPNRRIDLEQFSDEEDSNSGNP